MGGELSGKFGAGLEIEIEGGAEEFDEGGGGWAIMIEMMSMEDNQQGQGEGRWKQ